MRRLLPLLVALLVVAGCGGSGDGAAAGPTNAGASASPSSSPSPSSGAAPRFGRYVALGDSYTAAPYVYLTDVADGCLRSNANYPALLAKKIGATSFTDVSCSGATTQDLLTGQTTGAGNRIRPQLDAVTAGTDLVTLGIGGNDNGLFGSLVGSCLGNVGQPAGSPGCGDVDVPAAQKKLIGLRANIARVVTAIETKAPDAEVLLVGYPQLVAAGSTCPTLPIPSAALPAVDRLTRALDAAVRGAASDTGATYIDVYAASKGHDICAGDQAWVNGVKLDQQRAAPFHPFDVEQQAVAGLVEKTLG